MIIRWQFRDRRTGIHLVEEKDTNMKEHAEETKRKNKGRVSS